MRELCVSQVCVCVRGRRREAGGADGSAQPKTRTPQQDVGKNIINFVFLHCIFYILKILHIFVVTFISCSLTGHIYIYIIYIYIFENYYIQNLICHF